MADLSRAVQEYLELVRQCLQEVEQQDLASVVQLLYQAYARGASVYVMGNGGSASTASHMTAHLQEGIDGRGTGGLRAICLSDNVPRLTALANDVAYDEVFALQLNGLLRPEDLVVLISGSGNSPNLVKAAQIAKDTGTGVIAFTGFGGGRVHHMADCGVVLSCRQYGPVEDVHLTLGHLIPQLLRRKIQDAEASRVS